ncbi:hypothetical protein H6F93_03635 [Leptolyngbya sp. FACHB-671]|uniref:hypothetical protein n=1 Tax=Leptolyngbya sp. FACHB-671 TaxID=2692812 RepID=UPI0016852E8F|nr:hypothetical protein [Leptolyngbya sp. FACHB-671]MBD2066622.1 hypothetical protein [Leptolyngbya sp. FACHB-671]
MFSPVKISRLTPVLLTAPLLLWAETSTLAHKVEVSGNVAGLWHIEPNHSPKSGEPAQVWVALTQEGGAIVPLEQCNCKLTVYSAPYTEGEAPVLEPTLEAISAEQYQGIPGAEVVFPEAGEYELRFNGAPQAGADFQPFEISYVAIVGRGTAPITSPSTQTTTSTEETQTVDNQSREDNVSGDSQAIPANQTHASRLPIIILVVALLLGGLGLIVRQTKLFR